MWVNMGRLHLTATVLRDKRNYALYRTISREDVWLPVRTSTPPLLLFEYIYRGMNMQVYPRGRKHCHQAENSFDTSTRSTFNGTLRYSAHSFLTLKLFMAALASAMRPSYIRTIPNVRGVGVRKA